jgi:hypothetical protein
VKRPYLRISKTQEATLCALAEKQGLSVSDFMDRLLAFGEESKKMGEVRVDSKTLNGIVSCSDEEDLAKMGRKFGERVPKTYLAAINRPCNFESCYYLLTKILGEHNNWYEIKIVETPEAARFILLDSNKLGHTWLRFIGEYASAMVHSLLNVNAKLSIMTDRVQLEVPKQNQQPSVT